MRNFFSSLILFVAITSATLSTSSCSNDEGNIAEKAIVGKWKLEKKGSSPWTGKEKTLLFQEDGTVTCHSDQINYQGIYAINNVSVKEGIETGIDGEGRYMRNFTQDELISMIAKAGLEVLDIINTEDAFGRGGFTWLSMIAKKVA